MYIPTGDPQDTPQYEAMYTTPIVISDPCGTALTTEELHDTVSDHFRDVFEGAEYSGTLSRCYVATFSAATMQSLPSDVAAPLYAEMRRRGVSHLEVVVIERD